jgi:hypothetical protein
MTEHCGQCGSRKCNHGNCPECRPCTHCDGGDRTDKFFGYDAPSEQDRYTDRSFGVEDGYKPGWTED